MSAIACCVQLTRNGIARFVRHAHPCPLTRWDIESSLIDMLTIILALAATDLGSQRTAYQQCVVTQAVALGAGNQESADTILRAVRFKCDAAWQQLETSFPTGSGVPIAENARSNALAKLTMGVLASEMFTSRNGSVGLARRHPLLEAPQVRMALRGFFYAAESVTQIKQKSSRCANCRRMVGVPVDR